MTGTAMNSYNRAYYAPNNRQNPAFFAAQLDRFFFTFAEQIVILAIFHFYLNC